MCAHGACRVVGQLLGPSHTRVDLVVESQQGECKLLRPLPAENQWLSLPLAIGKIGIPSGRSQAVGTDQAEGVRDVAG